MSQAQCRIAAGLVLASMLAGCSGEVVLPGDAVRAPAVRDFSGELELSVARDPGSLDVEVRIQRLAWTAECNGRTTRNELRIPADRRIRASIHCDEPLEFTIPAFRVRRAVAPGNPSEVWFEAFAPGVHPVVLLRDEEQGGSRFESREVGTVTVVTAEEFERAAAGAGGVSAVVWILPALLLFVVVGCLTVQAFARRTRRGAQAHDIVRAHDRSKNHREQLARAARCGCFHCCTVFDVSEIEEWVDPAKDGSQRGTTALCPRCGIDSVLPLEPGMNADFLQRMKDHWFGLT